MSNIKLKDHNWAAEGIYDTNQSKSQQTINSDVSTKIGQATLQTSSKNLSGATNELKGRADTLDSKYDNLESSLNDALTQDNLSMSLFSTGSTRRLANCNDAPYGQSSYDPNTTNIPSGGSNYGIIQCYYAMGWFIQIAYDTYGNVYKRSNVNNNGWQAWKKLIAEDQVIPIAEGGTGATAAWAAKANLGVPLGASYLVVQAAGSTVNVPSGSIFICFMDGGLFQLSCTNAGIPNWTVMVTGNQTFTVDVSVKNKITITPSSLNAVSLNWICFSERALTLA